MENSKLIILAIALFAIGIIVYELFKAGKGLFGFFGNIGKAVEQSTGVGAIPSLVQGIEGMGQTVSTDIGNVFKSLGSDVTGVEKGLSSGITNVEKNLTSIPVDIGNFFKTDLGRPITSAFNFVKTTGTDAGKVINTVKTDIGHIIKPIENIPKEVTGIFGNISKVFKPVESDISHVIKPVEHLSISNFVKPVTSDINNVIKPVESAGQTAVKDVENTGKTIVSDIANFFRGFHW